MAKRTLYFSQLRPPQMNDGESYRVKFPYGTFTIRPEKTVSGTYYRAYKRRGGKLHWAYIGKTGDITADEIHKGCLTLAMKMGLI